MLINSENNSGWFIVNLSSSVIRVISIEGVQMVPEVACHYQYQLWPIQCQV